MYKNIKILDTTLRDGGRIINCKYPDEHIIGIIKGLNVSGIDIIELGFLRSNIEYNGNSTFFTELDQVKQFIPISDNKSMYVIFADYGIEYNMWDFNKIKKSDNKTITGFRIAYRKEDLLSAINIFNMIKENGYKLFMQGVESFNYSDKEMLEAIEIANSISPYAFGIVDTFGHMYKKNFMHLYNLIDYNLDEDIALDFHFHNNMQLAFSFAQEVIDDRKSTRDIIIDSTLEGVTRGAGNLNTELIIDYMNREHYSSYDLDIILDTIDEYISYLKKENSWSYSIPYYLAGVYSSHANNISYLMDKHKLNSKDIKHIISMIEPQKRKRYDYRNIEKLYTEYVGLKIDDSANIKNLKKEFNDNKILILAPGYTITEYSEHIKNFIITENPIVISINFIFDVYLINYIFFGNPRRYKHLLKDLSNHKIIISSNVPSLLGNEIIVNYNSLIDRGYKYCDNSAIILLNLLKIIGNENIYIAGLDGFDINTIDNYYCKDYNLIDNKNEYEQFNIELKDMLRNFSKKLNKKDSIKFLTPSKYESIFLDDKIYIR